MSNIASQCIPSPKGLRGTILYFCTALAVLAMPLAQSAPAAAAPSITPCFTPGGACTDLIVSTIGSARREIRVQAYSFTSAPIAKALVDAHRRGVDVQVILDKSQATAKYTGATYLQHAGIPVLIDDKVAIAHNKVIVIDGRITETGSFNYTKAAQARNAENVIIIDDEGIARAYLANWENRAKLARPYKRLE